jgi:hypothetical protein
VTDHRPPLPHGTFIHPLASTSFHWSTGPQHVAAVVHHAGTVPVAGFVVIAVVLLAVLALAVRPLHAKSS